MLVAREVIDAVEIVTIRGPIGDQDALALAGVLADATALQPRGVLVDLSDAGALCEGAFSVLESARREAPGWPRPSLLLCCDQKGRDAALRLLTGPVHAARRDGLAHVDDRSAAPRWRIALEHSPRSPARARAAATDALNVLSGARAGMTYADLEGGCATLVDEVSLVVSELVTNAVRHAVPPLVLEIEMSDDEVLVAVDDGSPGRPVLTYAPADAEGGRGLQLVDQVSMETGIRPQPPGKTVWAALRRRPPHHEGDAPVAKRT
ncbi:MAG: ATP-binding protein [Mycobacteriales bacterium]